ncbi:recombinase family protein [Aureimonas psammosilenae]|uniref:hypothetical protein n=1 Tax=Aureimonas psammosilenae TaxID=2495496 RepID=UPI0012609097|nr:hypothetical protein [Aureimonas psammosilenae]
MSALVTTENRALAPARAPREIMPTDDAVPMLDTAKFEHMQRIANVMASTSMIPDTLRKVKNGGSEVDLSPGQVIANCFLVVNQAVRWGMDPFAVAQCVSIVHGKLCYEGKLVSAVLDAKLGTKLHHHLIGSGEARRIYLSDRPFDEGVIAKLTPGIRLFDRRMFDGSVAEWKTDGKGTPWTPKNFDRMLIYRGTRDWARIYEPAIMLGVYTPDEMLDLSETARSNRARDVTGERSSLSQRLIAAKERSTTTDEGFARPTAEQPAPRIAEAEEEQPQEPDSERDDAPPADDDGEDDRTPQGGEGAEREEEQVDARGAIDNATRNLLAEAASKFLTLASDETMEPQDRRAQLGATVADWKREIQPDFHPRLKRVLDRADAVAQGKLSVQAAVKLLAAEIGVKEGDVEPAGAR